MRQSILAITVLLLSLTTHVSAQNRSPKEALEGLRDIGVVVKYGETDGLSEIMQPNTPQVLHDRARMLLSDADIPVLQSTDEADMVGRPRLVFTITLNRLATATAPAIHVDSRLYERVRLWRDSSKELELATWVTGGVGQPTVTSQMLRDVFDQQVKQFVEDYRAVNPKHQQLENRTPDPPAQLRNNTNSLQGLSGTNIFVWSGPSRSVEAPLEALLKTLQSEAEKKVKEAGIPLLKYVTENEAAGRPLLYVSIRTSQLDSHPPVISVETEFWQHVRPLRDLKKNIYAVTWESEVRENRPVTDAAVLQAVNKQVAEFIKAYQTANPKMTSVRR